MKTKSINVLKYNLISRTIKLRIISVTPYKYIHRPSRSFIMKGPRGINIIIEDILLLLHTYMYTTCRRVPNPPPAVHNTIIVIITIFNGHFPFIIIIIIILRGAACNKIQTSNYYYSREIT